MCGWWEDLNHQDTKNTKRPGTASRSGLLVGRVVGNHRGTEAQRVQRTDGNAALNTVVVCAAFGGAIL
jgi:hypothetical protein